MIILTYEQGTEEWKEARRELITGTRLADALGSPAKQESLINELIAERLTGQTKEIFSSPAMQHGTEAEEYAIREYEQMTGEMTEQVGLCISEEFPFLASSPDRLIMRDGKYKKAVEVKCPNTETVVRYIRNKGIPSEYEAQVYAYFLVNPYLDELDFVIYDARILDERYRLTIIHINRIDLDLLRARTKLIAFRERWLDALANLQLTF